MTSRTAALDALRVVLEGIDGTGSFNNDLSVVKEVPTVPDMGLLPYAVLHTAEGRYLDAGGALTAIDLDITMEAWARFSPPGETAQDAGNKMLDDIERAVAANRSLGNTVVDTTLKRNQVFTTSAGDSIVVVLVEATIKYRHAHGSP